MVIDQEIQYNK